VSSGSSPIDVSAVSCTSSAGASATGSVAGSSVAGWSMVGSRTAASSDSVSVSNSSFISAVVQPAGEHAEQRVEAEYVGGVDDDCYEHDQREAADFRPLRPGDLAHLIAHFPQVQSRRQTLFALTWLRRRGARRPALLVQRSHLLQRTLLFSVEVIQ